jgi:hypothetical protein
MADLTSMTNVSIGICDQNGQYLRSIPMTTNCSIPSGYGYNIIHYCIVTTYSLASTFVTTEMVKISFSSSQPYLPNLQFQIFEYYNNYGNGMVWGNATFSLSTFYPYKQLRQDIVLIM